MFKKFYLYNYGSLVFSIIFRYLSFTLFLSVTLFRNICPYYFLFSLKYSKLILNVKLQTCIRLSMRYMNNDDHAYLFLDSQGWMITIDNIV